MYLSSHVVSHDLTIGLKKSSFATGRWYLDRIACSSGGLVCVCRSGFDGRFMLPEMGHDKISKINVWNQCFQLCVSPQVSFETDKFALHKLGEAKTVRHGVCM